MTKTLKVGARDSQLSLLQAETALVHLRNDSGWAFSLIPFSSPGDRDQGTDLRVSPGDFFTRDLDAALLRGEIDLAIHSAKDLPLEGFPEGLDWFWLPWREEAGDCLVLREGVEAPKVIGVSSARREAWVAQTFPSAERKSIRGAIPARLAQLDDGAYDAVVTAVAALHRLGLSHRIARKIPLDELTPPPGQGVLAVTFRRNDATLRALRNLYLRAVRFVGAGVGDAELCTLAGIRELRTAEVVIYDALMDAALLDEAPRAEKIYVGKRSGAHAMKQAEITALIGERVRRGERVVRLKGGDPGLFGRLAEETEALEADGLPFRVWAGVSALAAATTQTGMLLTRRGESKGFHVATPRSEGAETPDVYFMALGLAAQLAESYPPETPCAVVYAAGSPEQEIKRLTVGALATTGLDHDARPGILIVGRMTQYGFTPQGPLAGKRVWITGSASVAEKARLAVTDLGGIPVVRPLITFTPTATIKIRPSKAYNLLVVTSPTAARMMLDQMVSPIQYLPKRLAVTGPGTAAVLRAFNIDTVMPEADYSARGLLAALPEDLTGTKILRLRSEEAGPELAQALKARGAKVKDLPFYKTSPLPQVTPPPHDVVFLASSSAAEAWLREPTDAPVIAMGEPTAATLRARGVEPAIVAPVQTVREALFAYARTQLP